MGGDSSWDTNRERDVQSLQHRVKSENYLLRFRVVFLLPAPLPLSVSVSVEKKDPDTDGALQELLSEMGEMVRA